MSPVVSASGDAMQLREARRAARTSDAARRPRARSRAVALPSHAQRHRAGERRNVGTKRESTSTASMRRVPWSKSMTPNASRLSRTRSLVAIRQDRADAAEDDERARVRADLVEDRELDIDHHRRAPVDLHQGAEEVAAAARREQRRQAARATSLTRCSGSLGNRTFLQRAAGERGAFIARSSNVRWIASMPPMPRSVKPRPIGIGWKSSAVMKTSSEKPFLAVGIACRDEPDRLQGRGRSGASGPARRRRACCAASWNRRPPPVTKPESTSRASHPAAADAESEVDEARGSILARGLLRSIATRTPSLLDARIDGPEPRAEGGADLERESASSPIGLSRRSPQPHATRGS